MKMRRRAPLAVLSLAMVPLACNAIWGIDELTYDGPGTGLAAGGAAGHGGGGPGGHTSTGGGGGGTGGTGVVQDHLWSRRFGDELSQQIRAVAVGPDNSIALAGEYAGTLALSAIVQITSTDQTDLFIAMLDADGNAQWATSGYGPGQQFVRGVAFAPGGSVFAVGHFYQSLTIDTEVMNADNEPNLYVVKLGTAGNLQWSLSPNVADSQRAAAVAMIGGTDIVVTGDFQNDISFGGPVLSGTAGDDDVFLVRFANDGAHSWSLGVPGANEQRAFDVAVDAANNIYIAGHLRGTMEFQSDPKTSAGGTDVYLAKFASTGAYAWSRRFGDEADQGGFRVAVDGEGNLWLTGTFGGVLDLDGQVLTAEDDADVFLAKLDSDGNVLNARTCAGPAVQTAYGLGVDAQQAALLTGACAGSVDCGQGALSGAGLQDVLLVRVGANGDPLGTERFGDPLDQHGRAVAFDSEGRLVLAGNFWGTLELGGDALQSAGSWDIFVAKLGL